MTKEERQQSLTKARLAAKWLHEYAIDTPNGRLWQEVGYLIAGFKLLDAKEQKQIRAGAKGENFGHLGAEHGKKGGRPRKRRENDT